MALVMHSGERSWEIMIKLSKPNRYKLFDLVKERDGECWETYEEILGIPFPGERIHVHHVKPVGSGGEDIADNLISLSPAVHFYTFHNGWGSVDKEWQKIAMKYLESEAVKQWTEKHAEELKGLYKTSETTRIQKTRKGCMPEKRPGLPF